MWEIDHLADIGIQTVMPDAPDHTDNLYPHSRSLRETTVGQPPSNRIGVRPQPALKRFVNDGDARLASGVLRGEETAGQQRRFHDLEIVGCDDALIHFKARQIVAFGIGGDALEGERNTRSLAAER